MDEVPDRPIVDLETAVGEFRDKTSQRKRLVRADAVAQIHSMSVSDRLRLVAHLPGLEAARFAKTPHPINNRARRDAELSRRPSSLGRSDGVDQPLLLPGPSPLP